MWQHGRLSYSLPDEVERLNRDADFHRGHRASPRNPDGTKVKAARKHIRVVLIQESESDANSIVEALRSAGMQAVFERVESKAALAAALGEFDPDVVLSDYSVPNLDFREALSVVQSVRPYTPLIVVTDLLCTEDSGSCVRAGAESVVSKLNLARLAGAIDEALEARGPMRKLTSRQIEVMRLVTQGYRTKEIAFTLRLSEKTVESHRHQLMNRLGLSTHADLIRYAVRVGLTLASPLSSIAYMLTHGVDGTIEPEDRAEVTDLAG